jgi:hypothetical protein
MQVLRVGERPAGEKRAREELLTASVIAKTSDEIRNQTLYLMPRNSTSEKDCRRDENREDPLFVLDVEGDAWFFPTVMFLKIVIDLLPPLGNKDSLLRGEYRGWPLKALKLAIFRSSIGR